MSAFISCNRILVLCLCAAGLVGCAINKPYAKNKFNPYAKLSPQKSTGKISDSPVFRGMDVGLAAASKSVPNSMPKGAGIGISTTLFLLKSKPNPLNVAEHDNYLSICMPLTVAESEVEAQIKMGNILETALVKTLATDYQTKIEEYDDHYLFGEIKRPRWMRVNGPLCENWSCQIIAPMPTATSAQADGQIRKYYFKGNKNDERYGYKFPFKDHKIGFVKIIKEYDREGSFGSGQHVVESVEIPQFDYQKFYQRLSENLPEWAVLNVAITGTTPYTLNKGVILQNKLTK